MKIVRGIGKLAKPFVNFPQWMGWGQISSAGKTIKETGQSLFEKPKANRQESFEQAVARMHLSEKDLQQRMQTFLRMTMIYGAFALALFAYVIYLVITAHFAAAFLSLILTVLALTLAFRQHFWYFQIKQRKLGCTVKEWFNSTFRGKQG